MLAKPRLLLALSTVVMIAIPILPVAASAGSSASQCYVLFQTDADRQANLAAAAQQPADQRIRGIPGASHDLLKTDLKNLLSNVETNYGPRSLKQATIGLVWEKFKNRILSSLNRIHSLSDFHFAVADSLNSLNDAHVSVSLPSTLVYSLPMQFSDVNGKVILSYLVPSQFDRSRNQFKLPKLGDQLIAVNGQSLDDYQKSNPYFAKYGNDISNRAVFAHLISSLREELGYPVSRLASQDVTLTFASATGQFDVKTRYKSAGIGLIDRGAEPMTSVALKPTKAELAVAQMRAKADAILQGLRSKFFKNLKPTGRAAFIAMNQQTEKFHALLNVEAALPLVLGKKGKEAIPKDAIGKKLTMGEREPYFKLPADFTELKFPDPQLAALMNGDSFFAGTFQRDGKTIGLLRIPAYSVAAPETMLASIRLLIGFMEGSTDELIIDQTFNPGGMVAMSDLVVKSLVGQYDDSKHMQFLVKPNSAFLRNFAELIDSVQNDASFLRFREKADFVARLRIDYNRVRAAFDSGADLSEPVSLRVMSEFLEKSQDAMIQQSSMMKQISTETGVDLEKPQVYTKKVYFLINEFDASGGDATPAVLQDYGRVTLVGVRTMGAGGSVEEFRDRTLSDIGYHLTTSLMYRKDGKFVENYGVHPDVDFNLTESDYTDGFANVLDRMLSTIKKSGK